MTEDDWQQKKAMDLIDFIDVTEKHETNLSHSIVFPLGP